MITSKIDNTIEKKVQNKSEAYVWIFLPQKTKALVAGKITKENEKYSFIYGQNYLNNPDSIPLSPFELPKKRGVFTPEGMNTIHSCIRDAGPDAWGRRLIGYQYPYLQANELDYLLLSGSNRIGALDFQESINEYRPKEVNNITLEELFQVAKLVFTEKPIPKELECALIRGTSIGGARPKALIYSDNKEYIVKFGLSQDIFNPIKAEFIGMTMAKKVGIIVPPIKLHNVLGKDILIIERFDREYQPYGVTRKLMLSALSLLNLNEMEARYASYIDLAEIIRQKFKNPRSQLHELYSRLIFNVLIGNTDDHARNHSAFWDGIALELTPAYDLCPQIRTGYEASQAMIIGGSEGNLSTLKNVLSVSQHFQLNTSEAKSKIEQMIIDMQEFWTTVCEMAELSSFDQEKLWQKSVFNPYCFQGW